MNAEHLQRVVDLLLELSRTIGIIIIAQRMAEASSDEEKVYLSQSMTALMNEQRNPRLGGGGPSQSPYGGPRMF